MVWAELALKIGSKLWEAIEKLENVSQRRAISNTENRIWPSRCHRYRN